MTVQRTLLKHNASTKVMIKTQWQYTGHDQNTVTLQRSWLKHNASSKVVTNTQWQYKDHD